MPPARTTGRPGALKDAHEAGIKVAVATSAMPTTMTSTSASLDRTRGGHRSGSRRSLRKPHRHRTARRANSKSRQSKSLRRNHLETKRPRSLRYERPSGRGALQNGQRGAPALDRPNDPSPFPMERAPRPFFGLRVRGPSTGPPGRAKVLPGTALRIALGMQDLGTRILRGVELKDHPLWIWNTRIRRRVE